MSCPDPPSSPPTRELRPGYVIPRRIHGGWQLAVGHRPGNLDRQQVLDSLERLVELGFGTFDCADIYEGVEELYGELLRRRRRAVGSSVDGRADRPLSGDGSAIRIHTKFVPDRSLLPRLGQADVVRAVDRSLGRLGVDCLDLVQFHWWDWQVPGWLDALGWLDAERRAGKVRHLAVTNFDCHHLSMALAEGLDIAAHQLQYSLLDRRPENGMVRLCAENDVHLLCYGTLAGGFLADRFRGRADPGLDAGNRSLTKYRLIIDEITAGRPGEAEEQDRASASPSLSAAAWQRFEGLLEVLATVAGRHGVSISDVATRWVLDRPGVAAAIVGIRRSPRTTDPLSTFGFRLAERDRAEIAAVLEHCPGPAGEIYGLERVEGGRHAAIMKTELGRLDQ